MVFINLVRSGPASFNARRKPWMVGDDFTLSLTACCFTSGLSDFPGDEGGAFSRLLRLLSIEKVLRGLSEREIRGRICD